MEISKRASSRFTASPAFLSHLVMVASTMLSPICGMMTSTVPVATVRAAGAGAGAAVGAAGAAAGAGAGAAAGAEVGAGAGAAATLGAATGAGALAPPSSMRATIAFTATTLPSSTSTAERVPDAGEGISLSTLSVEISKSGSSRFTASPGFFNQRVSVASTMLSPIWGITTSIM